jgi:outer membrane protein assembly factor BamB
VIPILRTFAWVWAVFGACLALTAVAGSTQSSSASVNLNVVHLASTAAVNSSISWSQFQGNVRHTGLVGIPGPAANTTLWVRGLPVTHFSHIVPPSSVVQGTDGTVWVSQGALWEFHPNGSLVGYHFAGGWGPYSARVVAILNTPAIATGGNAVIGTALGSVASVSESFGTLWHAGAANTPTSTASGISSAAAIPPNGEIFIAGSNSGLYALRPDGSRLWSTFLSSAVTSAPTIASDGTVYVGTVGGTVDALSPAGAMKWSFTTGGAISGSVSIGPTGQLYVGSHDGNLYSIRPNGSLAWSYATGGPVETTPSIGANGAVYFGSDDGNLYSLNPNGTLRWTFSTSGKLVGSAAIGSNGLLYIGSTDGSVYAISTAGGLSWQRDLGSPILTSPAIGLNARLFVTTSDGALWAFG